MADEAEKPAGNALADAFATVREGVSKGDVALEGLGLAPVAGEEAEGAEEQEEKQEQEEQQAEEAEEVTDGDDGDEKKVSLAEALGGEEEAGEEEAGEEGMVEVAIPGRQPGTEETITVRAEDEERLNQLRNGYLRRESLDRRDHDLSTREDERVAFEQSLRLDPIGVVMDYMKPDTKVDMARNLLADPHVFEVMRDEVAKWYDDDTERRLAHADMRETRGQAARQRDQQVSNSREMSHRARELTAGLEKVALSIEDDAAASRFVEDARRDLRAHLQTSGRNDLTTAELPTILDQRMRLYGVDPSHAAAVLAGTAPPTPTRRPTGRRAGTGTGGKPSRPGPTGEQFVRGSRAKQAASRVPKPGAGGQPQTVELPKGQSVKDRIAHLRKNKGLLGFLGK